MTTYEPSFTFSSSEPQLPDWMRGQRLEDFAPMTCVVVPLRDKALDDYTVYLLPETVCPVCLEPLDSPFCRCNWDSIAAGALTEVASRDNGGIEWRSL
jgi:hypothetical protein